MSGIKKFLKRSLLAIVSRWGQGNDWRRNLEYNAPGAAKKFVVDAIFVVLALALSAVLVVAGVYEFIFASPLSASVRLAANSISQTTPNQVRDDIMNLSQSNLGDRSLGDLLGSVAAGINPLIGALTGLLDEIFGLLLVLGAVVIRFSHRMLGMFIGNRPANENGVMLSWIILGIAFAVFVFGPLI